MKQSLFPFLAAGIIALSFGAQRSHALSVTYDGSSLHGSSGTLTVDDMGGGNFNVTWAINLTGFDDAGAISTGHEYLTEVAFKAFSSISSVSLAPADSGIGTLYYPSNVNNHGCDTDSSGASFVCVTLDPHILATTDGTFSATFAINGTLKEDGWSFRGKYGTDNGWVISEPAPAIPEPSAALLFGIGALLVGSRSRRI